MAYKDEYEVARLYTDGEFLQEARRSSSRATTSSPSTSRRRCSPTAIRRPASCKKREYGAVDAAGVPLLARAEAAARHRVRRLRLHRGAPHGAPPDRRIRGDDRRRCWRRSTRTTTRSRSRSRGSPRRCAASATSRRGTSRRRRSAKPRCSPPSAAPRPPPPPPSDPPSIYPLPLREREGPAQREGEG